MAMAIEQQITQVKKEDEKGRMALASDLFWRLSQVVVL